VNSFAEKSPEILKPILKRNSEEKNTQNCKEFNLKTNTYWGQTPL